MRTTYLHSCDTVKWLAKLLVQRLLTIATTSCLPLRIGRDDVRCRGRGSDS